MKDVRFTDDQGMVASSEEGLQKLMNGLITTTKRYNMKVNVKKTKTMLVSRVVGGTVNILIDGQQVEQVKEFKYLGALITEDGKCEKEVRVRIGMAKSPFNDRKELLRRNISQTVTKKIVKTLVWSVRLSHCESAVVISTRVYCFQD